MVVLRNHGWLVVWQDVEDESVSSGAGSAPSPEGIPSTPPLTGLMNLHLSCSPDANPEILPKHATALAG